MRTNKGETSRLASFVFGVLLVAGCGSSPGSPDGGGGGDDGAGGDATGPGGAGVGASSSSGGSGGDGAGAPSFEGLARVDDGSGTAVAGSADVAIAPDGTIYASWVDTRNGAEDAFVARSTDGGASFEPAVRIDDDSVIPLVSMARHPYVAASADRVAIIFSDQGGIVRLYVSAAGGPLSFGDPIVIGADVPTTSRDFPKQVFLSDGSIAIAFHGYPDSGARIFVARESEGYASTDASGGAPGLPCECCPLDVVQADSGDVMVAFRNNDNDTREMWLADGPAGAGAFTSWAPLSSSEGFVDSCPMQGPRLAQLENGTRVATWSSRGADTAGSVFMSSSTDGGATWSGGSSVGGFVADEPTIAIGASGTIYVTGVVGSGKSSMLSSTDGGSTWSQPEQLKTPDGDLGVPQAEGSGGVAALASVSSAGTVWLRRME